MPSAAWEALTPAGQRTVYGGSLHALGRNTIEERSRGLRFRRFSACPDFAEGNGRRARRLPGHMGAENASNPLAPTAP
jgi:hypothetical protein